VGILDGRRNDDEKAKDYSLHAVRAEGKNVQSPGDDIFLIQTAWMGEQAAWEILESVSEKAFKNFA
jgi:hypothetical protein